MKFEILPTDRSRRIRIYTAAHLLASTLYTARSSLHGRRLHASHISLRAARTAPCAINFTRPLPQSGGYLSFSAPKFRRNLIVKFNRIALLNFTIKFQ